MQRFNRICRFKYAFMNMYIYIYIYIQRERERERERCRQIFFLLGYLKFPTSEVWFTCNLAYLPLQTSWPKLTYRLYKHIHLPPARAHTHTHTHMHTHTKPLTLHVSNKRHDCLRAICNLYCVPHSNRKPPLNL